MDPPSVLVEGTEDLLLAVRNERLRLRTIFPLLRLSQVVWVIFILQEVWLSTEEMHKIDCPIETMYYCSVR